jgi:hypothetical protein
MIAEKYSFKLYLLSDRRNLGYTLLMLIHVVAFTAYQDPKGVSVGLKRQALQGELGMSCQVTRSTIKNHQKAHLPSVKTMNDTTSDRCIVENASL